ncbi:hypothetical protein [Alienimonas californiensis]|uniref:Uncharacterized protein n=1 Tax=Alienimonas californiensis TaxID=2527989 RepID=A0A517P968_9PLAN|nr:hypothetical protein [Alienimonas californiensis]QDT15920.1 hypothetical protein CA12_20180 [Alienimonas californiensis]
MSIPDACPMCGSSRSHFKLSRSTGRAKCGVCGEVFESDGDDVGGGTALERPRRSGSGGRGRAADRVKSPAIALLVVGGLSLLSSLGYSALTGVAALNGPPPPEPGLAPAEAAGRKAGFYIGAIGFPLATLTLTGLILMGGYQMLNVQSWGWALTGTLAAMVPCCNFTALIGFPIGIWVLIVLFDPQVKAAFR